MGDFRKIRVAIADDNQQFRETLREILAYEDDLEIVGVWENGMETLMELGRAMPDVLLLDINMPVMNGIEATKQLKNRFPNVSIVILTMHDDEGYVLETLKLGASGYLVKDGSVKEIVDAVHEVAAGKAIVDPQVTHKVIHQFQARVAVDDSWRDLLTPREMDVLREVAAGKTNEQVAETLSITPKTVKHHLGNLFLKLGVTDRTQAVLVAVKKHWIVL